MKHDNSEKGESDKDNSEKDNSEQGKRKNTTEYFRK